MNFNLIPHDSDSYKIYADFQEDNGAFLTNAVRNKILPLDQEKGNGEGCNRYLNDGYEDGYGWGNGYGNGYGLGYGCGGNGYGCGVGYGDGHSEDNEDEL